MADEEIYKDVKRAMCAAVWIMFFLTMKNIVLLFMLAIQRRKHSIYRIPEDAAGRIQRVLTNDVEYIPCFLALLIIMFCTAPIRAVTFDHYLARVLPYGIFFTRARYLHTISYLLWHTYGRLLICVITVIILVVMTIDHLYDMTKGLSN